MQWIGRCEAENKTKAKTRSGVNEEHEDGDELHRRQTRPQNEDNNHEEEDYGDHHFSKITKTTRRLQRIEGGCGDHEDEDRI